MSSCRRWFLHEQKANYPCQPACLWRHLLSMSISFRKRTERFWNSRKQLSKSNQWLCTSQWRPKSLALKTKDAKSVRDNLHLTHHHKLLRFRRKTPWILRRQSLNMPSKLSSPLKEILSWKSTGLWSLKIGPWKQQRHKRQLHIKGYHGEPRCRWVYRLAKYSNCKPSLHLRWRK